MFLNQTSNLVFPYSQETMLLRYWSGLARSQAEEKKAAAGAGSGSVGQASPDWRSISTSTSGGREGVNRSTTTIIAMPRPSLNLNQPNRVNDLMGHPACSKVGRSALKVEAGRWRQDFPLGSMHTVCLH